MFERFNQNAKNAINIAADISKKTRNGVLGSEHVLLGLLYIDCKARDILASVGVTKENFAIASGNRGGNQLELSARIYRMEEVANKVAQQTNSYYVDTEHLLFAILMDSESFAVRQLVKMGVDLSALREKVAQEIGVQLSSKNMGGQDSGAKNDKKASETLGELAKFGTDLTQKAKDGKLDPVIGRADEIERVIQILSRRTKNNPILIGDD